MAGPAGAGEVPVEGGGRGVALALLGGGGGRLALGEQGFRGARGGGGDQREGRGEQGSECDEGGRGARAAGWGACGGGTGRHCGSWCQWRWELTSSPVGGRLARATALSVSTGTALPGARASLRPGMPGWSMCAQGPLGRGAEVGSPGPGELSPAPWVGGAGGAVVPRAAAAGRKPGPGSWGGSVGRRNRRGGTAAQGKETTVEGTVEVPAGTVDAPVSLMTCS